MSESTAWAIYRDRLKRFGTLIGDREPIVLHKEIPGIGRAKRYIITIADDDRRPLDKICQKLTAAEATCDVLRNPARQYFTEHHAASMTLANLTVPPGFGDRVGESRSLHAVPTNADL